MLNCIIPQCERICLSWRCQLLSEGCCSYICTRGGLSHELQQQQAEPFIVCCTIRDVYGPQFWHAWWSATSCTWVHPDNSELQNLHVQTFEIKIIFHAWEYFSLQVHRQANMSKTCLTNSTSVSCLTQWHIYCTGISLCEKKEHNIPKIKPFLNNKEKGIYMSRYLFILHLNQSP